MSDAGAVEPVIDVYDRSLADLFLAQVRLHADRPAIDAVDGQLSYAELGSLVEQFARGLRSVGLPAGGVVAVRRRWFTYPARKRSTDGYSNSPTCSTPVAQALTVRRRARPFPLT